MKNLALKKNLETDPMSKEEFIQKLQNIGKLLLLLNYKLKC